MRRSSSEDAREAWHAAATSVEELEAAVRAFDGCALKRTAKNTVFADGVVGSAVMIVGEAPGADEDRLGKPFVGVSGQLMDRMFDCHRHEPRARSLHHQHPVLAAARQPHADRPQQAVCMAFTRRHIELARPKVLVLAGGTAGDPCSTRPKASCGCAASGPASASMSGSTVPTLPTFHPAYLLRTPASKRQSWSDLLSLERELRELGSSRDSRGRLHVRCSALHRDR